MATCITTKLKESIVGELPYLNKLIVKKAEMITGAMKISSNKKYTLDESFQNSITTSLIEVAAGATIKLNGNYTNIIKSGGNITYRYLIGVTTDDVVPSKITYMLDALGRTTGPSWVSTSEYVIPTPTIDYKHIYCAVEFFDNIRTSEGMARRAVDDVIDGEVWITVE